MLTDQDIKKLTDVFATKGEMNQKFEKIDQKFEETNRHFDVVAEDIKGDIKLLAEQLSSNSEKLVEHDEKIENLTNDVSILKSKAGMRI